ncbi:TetR/AcrR family transcriptional regulator [Kribbella albertanoniae]|uniref:TetR family transcriptional regulator n=1 Tax=Kribbella albertanoniae TaxID=1266829 RepID=A0A4R4QJR0_9ACTN|nr:TetR/AcrR family transcriptional regulator [Kribbella albertanoniae]TDC35452.1 TetR family transcriptional regulator [Kribbella albertanoniae]
MHSAPQDEETPAVRGRPRLTARRREQTRVEIAVEASRLFIERGPANTSVDDIAAAAGISRRTFWHYFSTKEEAVAPVLLRSLNRTADAFERRPVGETLLEALGGALAELSGTDLDVAEVVGIVGLTREEPALRRVWLQATSDLEGRIAIAIANRTGSGSLRLEVRVQAAMIVAAVRITAEEYAWHGEEYREQLSIVQETLRLVAEGFLPDAGSR